MKGSGKVFISCNRLHLLASTIQKAAGMILQNENALDSCAVKGIRTLLDVARVLEEDVIRDAVHYER